MSRTTKELTSEVRGWLFVLVALGIGAFTYALFQDATRAWASYLTSAYYFMTLALGSLIFVVLLHLSKAGWSVVIKRIPEAIMGYVPIGGVTMLGLLLGMHSLYHWVEAHDPILAKKVPYLNPTFFGVRLVGFVVLWTLFAAALRRASLAQDKDKSVSHTRSSVAFSAVFLLLFAYTFSLAAVDWVKSIEPHWASTIFGFYNMSGIFLGSLAAITLVAIWLRRGGFLPEFTNEHMHDLGKLMFGAATFWAYIWVSQYLLIWYANIPEETAYYIHRTQGGWAFLFYLNLILNWLIPFLALLPRPAKRNEAHVFRVCILILVGRWLDVYLMVTPGLSPEHGGIGFVEVLVFGAFAAVFIHAVARALRSAPLIAKGDPYLVESLHHHQ